MARATKAPKNGTKGKNGVAAWDKAAGKVAPSDKTGVEQGDGGAFYVEDIPAAERDTLGKALAEACADVEELESQWRIESAEHRGKLKEAKAEVKVLREQVQTGTRKRPAQQSFPGELRAVQQQGGGEMT